MNWKVKSQIGKNNISGDGNHVTQSGSNNQNNSNNQNTTNNYYNSSSSNQENNELGLAFIAIALSLVLIFFLFKYYEKIEPIIKWIHLLLLGSIYPVVTLHKKNLAGIKDYGTFVLTVVIGLLSFYSFNYLEKFSEFSRLSEQATIADSLMKFWLNIFNNDLLPSAIFLAVGELLSIFILSMNIILMGKSTYYSYKAKPSNIYGLIIIFVLAILLVLYLHNPKDIISFFMAPL